MELIIIINKIKNRNNLILNKNKSSNSKYKCNKTKFLNKNSHQRRRLLITKIINKKIVYLRVLKIDNKNVKINNKKEIFLMKTQTQINKIFLISLF